jgi:SAM-dependent methyltransferase
MTPQPKNSSQQEASLPPASWREFWNRDTPIYVNARHKLLHYRLVADDMAGLVPSRAAHVLDHGCGEALAAERLAAACAKLYLCDAAPNVVTALTFRYAGTTAITPLLPGDLSQIPDASLDLVIANSLVQYLAEPEFAALLLLWKAKLRPGGLLVVADVIRTGSGPLPDALALLRFGWSGGFLLAALGGLVRTALSDYRRLRAQLGLATYWQGAMETLLSEAGYTQVRRRARNIGHNQARMAFQAQKRAI